MVKRVLIGFGLTLLALVAGSFLYIIGVFYATGIALHTKNKKAYLYYLGSIFWAMAYNIDTLACVILAPYLNRYFRHPNSIYYFGSPKNTISLIIGFIYYETEKYGDYLLPQGMKWYNRLERIEKGHCQLAIADFESSVIYKPPHLL